MNKRYTKNTNYTKIITLVFMVAILFFVSPQKALSQDETYTQRLSEYNDAKQRYNDAYIEYELRSAQYIRYKTLKSKEDAYNATLDMLISRDEVIIAYLTMLRSKLNESPGISTGRLESINVRLNEEIGWYEDQKARLPSVLTLEDLAKESEDSELRYEEITKRYYYEISMSISGGKMNLFNERFLDIFSQIQNKIDVIKSDEREEYKLSVEKLDKIDHWYFESESRMNQALEKKNAALLQIPTVHDPIITKKVDTVFDDIRSTLNESKELLLRAGSFARELLREIKVKDVS